MKSVKTLLLLTMVSGTMLVSSCKKDSPAPVINGKVRSATVSATGTASTTTTYTYDGQGRVIAEQGANGTVSYTYNSGSVTVTDVQGGTTIYTLNAQGRAISDNQGANYTYNDAGFLITETLGANSLTNAINGNDISSTTLIQNGTTTLIYSYLTNTDYRDFGKSFLGSTSAHVRSNLIVTSGGNATTYTYTYNYDSQGRVITETRTGNNSIVTTTYAYTS